MKSFLTRHAAVAEQADAQDLKSCGAYPPYGFDSRLRHRTKAPKSGKVKGLGAFFKGGMIEMSEREKAINLLNNLPDNKIVFVIAYLQGLSDGLEENPDDWDLEMIKAAQEENDGTVVSIDDLAGELGVSL